MCHSRQAVATNDAAEFAVVPFAVPVAVPVATITQPTYFYAYGAYAASADQIVAATSRESSPDANTQRPAAADGGNDLDRRAVEVIARRCVKCHSGDEARGELMIADDSGQVAQRLPRHRILGAVEAGKMPPQHEATPLSSDEIEAIRHWARLPRDLAY
ncbi:MAG: hypothetical protein R3C10_03725 [Pirellulales bacterium]